MKEKSSCCDLSRHFWFPDEWQVAAILLQPSLLTLPPDSRTEVPGTEMAVGDDGHGQAAQAVVIGPKCPHGSQAMGWVGGREHPRQRAGKQEEVGGKRSQRLPAGPAESLIQLCMAHVIHDEGHACEVGQGPGDSLPRYLISGPGESSQQSPSHSLLLQPTDPDLSRRRLWFLPLWPSASLIASIGMPLSVWQIKGRFLVLPPPQPESLSARWGQRLINHIKGCIVCASPKEDEWHLEATGCTHESCLHFCEFKQLEGGVGPPSSEGSPCPNSPDVCLCPSHGGQFVSGSYLTVRYFLWCRF